MRYVLSAIFCVLIAAEPVLGDELGEVRALLKGKIDAVVELLQDHGADKVRRNQQIIALITPIFDFSTMAKLSLGKKYWPSLDPGQQKRFSDLFIERLQQSYLDKLDIYTDENVLYGEARQQGNKIHITTSLVSKDSNIDMLYKFYHADAGWQIYDVEIGGVSVIQTYRSQFDGVLRDGNIDDLIEKLKVDGTFDLPSPIQGEARPGTG